LTETNEINKEQAPLVEITRRKLTFNNRDCQVLVLRDVSHTGQILQLSS